MLRIRKNERITQFDKTECTQSGYDDYVISVIYLDVKDPNEAKYQHLIRKREKMTLFNIKIQSLLLNIRIICRISV